MITLTIDELNLVNLKQFDMNVTERVISITVPISNATAINNILLRGIPVKGHEIKLNGLLLGHFHLDAFLPIMYQPDECVTLEFRAHIRDVVERITEEPPEDPLDTEGYM